MRLNLPVKLGILAVVATSALAGGLVANAQTTNQSHPPQHSGRQLSTVAQQPGSWTVDDYNRGYDLGHYEYTRWHPEPGFCQLRGRDKGNPGFALGFNDACTGKGRIYHNYPAGVV
ncbi:MAG: hypothetical protein DLM55_11070 [Acidimicrobiales bacterium]|nr:MAG: hypothetical protein DLM55_11070 [Acidimicrobiales bacterium]